MVRTKSGPSSMPVCTSASALSALAAVLPRDIVARTAESAPACFELAGEESVCCGRFAPKRLRDFTAGRYCARSALRALGCGSAAIPVGASREPVWPDGISGSIAHTEDLAGAIVGWRKDYLGLGLDLERLQDVDDLTTRICTPAERAGAWSGADYPKHVNVVFSAKEAVYKCLWPMVRRFVHFEEIELELNRAGRQFRVVRHDNVHPLAQRVSGRWSLTGDVVLAVAVLRRTSGNLT